MNTKVRGIDPEIWGPAGWKLLHGISFRKHADITKTWFLNFQHILPCCSCQENFKGHTEALGSLHKDVRKWVYKLHERVNHMKEKNTPSFADVVSYWKKHPLRWEDILPFLDAVVEAHPSKGNTVVGAYWMFWDGLLSFMDMPKLGLTKEITESRGKMRLWWKKYKKMIAKS